MDNEPLERQIDRLAACILFYFPDEPGSTGQSEGAIDVAVRLLERLAAMAVVSHGRP
jgi:hypothetical protein